MSAFLDAEALGERAGGHVADHDFERDDLDLANQLLAHVQPANEMGRHTDLAELGHQELGDAVVDHPLAGDHALLLIVESGGVVLEVLDDRPWLWSLEQGLGLALVDAAATSHDLLLCGRPGPPAPEEGNIGPEYGRNPMRRDWGKIH